MTALPDPVVRAFRPEDVAAVYDVCRGTGADGTDATDLHDDPDLLGHLWAGPFLALEPEHAIVLEDDAGVAGYCLGTTSTRRFEEACEVHWWPVLRGRHTDPAGAADGWTADQRLAHLVHHPPRSPDDVVVDHPAQLHLDLLPRAQGRRLGAVLMDRMLALLAAESPGVHVGVGPANARALAFYRRLGFADLSTTPYVAWMGRPLP